MKRPHFHFHLPNRVIIGIILAHLMLAALVIYILLPSGWWPGRTKKVSRTDFLMTTVVESLVYTRDRRHAEDALSDAYQEAARLEKLLDRYRATSDVGKINEAAGLSPVDVSNATYEVIARALEIAALTDGAFDITIAPLVDLWGFGTGDTHIPDQDALQAALAKVDYRQVVPDREDMSVFLAQPGMKLDLGGIAKGYIVDKAAEALLAKGVTSAYFDAGGDIRVIGEKPDGSPWRIGIRHPRNRNKLIAHVDLKNQAIVTSGDYERYFTADGVRYHHILDPKTGMPTREIISATVIAPDALTADALSTGIFVLGLERGLALIESLPGVEAIIITADETVHESSGVGDQLELRI